MMMMIMIMMRMTWGSLKMMMIYLPVKEYGDEQKELTKLYY